MRHQYRETSHLFSLQIQHTCASHTMSAHSTRLKYIGTRFVTRSWQHIQGKSSPFTNSHLCFIKLGKRPWCLLQRGPDSKRREYFLESQSHHHTWRNTMHAQAILQQLYWLEEREFVSCLLCQVPRENS